MRVDAQTDDPRKGRVQAVATASGMKFCSVVTTAYGARNDCEASEDALHDQDNRKDGGVGNQKRISNEVKSHSLRRIAGEQSIFCNTDVYVHCPQGQQTKGVRGFFRGKKGLDKV